MSPQQIQGGTRQSLLDETHSFVRLVRTQMKILSLKQKIGGGEGVEFMHEHFTAALLGELW